MGAEQQIIHSFSFDGVLTGSQATQENVYRATTMKLVQKGLLDGINGSLLCYGQRDSGKTYTVFGGSDFRARGIAARAVNQLFEGIRMYAQERVYSVAVTFVQLDGDHISDLLSQGGAGQAGHRGTMKGTGRSGSSGRTEAAAVRPAITLDAKGMVVLKGIERRDCSTEEEALAAVFEGLHQRSQKHSSHVVLTLYARHQSLIDSESATREACLHIVDLAGTQRLEKGSLSPEEHAEVQTVNRSLSMLEQVVISLANPPTNSNGEPVLGHVPYRQSKLTTLLKDCIGGTSMTSLIAHIYPEQQFLDNTIATLNFAKRMMHVSTDPTVNLVQDAGTQIRTLQRQVIDLKSELRMQSQLSLARVAQSSSAGDTAAKPTSFGTDELQALHEKVRAFVDGGSNTIHVNDVREMNACFNFFRTLLEQKDVTISELQNEMNAAKAQSYAQRQGGPRDMDTSLSQSAGLGTSPGEPATPSNSVSSKSSAAPAGKGKRRGTSNWRQQQQQPEKTDPHTPNVLDKHSGISYGVAGKASNTLQVPEREAPADYMDAESRQQQQQLQQQQMMRQANVTINNNVTNISNMNANNNNESSIPPIFKPASPAGVTGFAAADVKTGFTPRAAANAPLPPRPVNENSSRLRVAAVPEVQEPQPLLQGGFSQLKPQSLQHVREGSNQLSNSGSNISKSSSPKQGSSSKARAFEDYKNTESGALQVRALGEDREQLLKIDKKVSHLQRRLQELEYVMAEKAHHPSGGIRVPESRPQSGSHAHLPDNEGEEDPRHMSSLHLTAYHNTIQESLNTVNAERAHLTKQMERRRVALMTNFTEWYARISGDRSERPAQHPSGFPALGGSGQPQQQQQQQQRNPRRQQTSFLDDVNTLENTDEDVQRMMQLQDDRFLDAAERFTAMEMHRRTAQDPQSGAFYSARKLVESKTRDRPALRQ